MSSPVLELRISLWSEYVFFNYNKGSQYTWHCKYQLYSNTDGLIAYPYIWRKPMVQLFVRNKSEGN